MTIARTYAAYCSDLTYGDLPPEVVDRAKRLALDTIGIMVGAASRARSSDAIADAARTLDGTGRGATVLATGEELSAPYAAFLNGSLAHGLDFDDTHRGSSLHPGAPVLSAALATAERTRATGKDLLTGIVAGYEVICRLGMAVNAESHYARGFHGTATCGSFGATAAAGSVAGLSTEELANAFGVNGSQASGSLQFLENGGWNKRVHPGLAAKAGLEAIALAEAGFRAASNPIAGENGFFAGYTDDPRPALATRGLGESFELLETAIKPYPCCRYMHASLDLLLDIAESTGVDPADVERVRINLPSAGLSLVRSDEGDYPASLVDAQFSMRFGAALALTEGDAGIDSFVDAVAGEYDPAFTRLFDATIVEPSDDVDERYPDQWPARVIVETATDRFERWTDHARGEPENPLPEGAVEAKFDELAADLPESLRRTASERILAMEDSDAAAVVEPFSRAS